VCPELRFRAFFIPAPEPANQSKQTIMGLSTTTPTAHNFEMHPDLLRSVIKKQAGTLDKALLEGIMNSIDAGAKRVDVTIEPLRVTINDDGRGFRNADEVKDFFATFGTPHEEGDATYGRFRMGRGQMFAFGINSWRTGTFKMDVDINKRLGFELEEELPNQIGCSIEIKLYDALSLADVHNTTRAITKMVKYTPVPVYINGEKVNVDVDPKKFPQTIEEAYINTESSKYGGLDVYNLGVLVCTMPAWKFGVSGVVVSRQQLDVNFARNDILATCKVWRKIKAVVDASGKKEVTRRATLTEDEQENIINRLVTQNLSVYEADGIRFLRDVTGKAWTPAQVRRARFEAYSVAPRGNVYGDKLMQTGKAIVFDEGCIALFECEPHEVFKKFPFTGMPSFATLDSLTTGISSTGTILPKKQWKPSEKAWNAVARRMQGYLSQGRWDMNQRRYTYDYKARRIDIGTSDVANGWTDGATYIAIGREFLKGLAMFKRGVPNINAFTKMALLLIHEACHNTDSRENVHSPDFYREYHDTTIKHVGWMVQDALSYMTPARYKYLSGKDVDLDEAVEMPSESELDE